mmetsp:Transcript_99142/g.280096  ORF Transcript_99142/g.280096 Transcript_99142/m.280096 type:complete len:211 (-) Transcript_99142:836-1468(-)
MFPELVHERVHTRNGILQLLHVGSAHDEHLDFTGLFGQGQIHLVIFLEAVFGHGVILGGESEPFKDARKNAGNEWQEVGLHRNANAFRRGHHVLHDWVVGWQVWHLSGLDHGLHDALRVGPEGSGANSRREQGNALKELAKKKVFLDIVHDALNNRLEDRHQRGVIWRKGILHLRRDHGDKGDRLLLHRQLVGLDEHTEFLHQGLNERFQ